MPSDVLTVREAAELLQCSEETVRDSLRVWRPYPTGTMTRQDQEPSRFRRFSMWPAMGSSLHPVKGTLHPPNLPG